MDVVEAKLQILKLVNEMHRKEATPEDFKEILEAILKGKPVIISGFTHFDVFSELEKINRAEEYEEEPIDIDQWEANQILGVLRGVLARAPTKEDGLIAIQNEILRYYEFFQGRGEGYDFERPASWY